MKTLIRVVVVTVLTLALNGNSQTIIDIIVPEHLTVGKLEEKHFSEDLHREIESQADVHAKNELIENATEYNYHDNFGIPEAKRLRQYESSYEYLRTKRGIASALGEHPYQGGLIIFLTNGGVSMCGCCLLGHKRALTAAHCWSDGSRQAFLFTVVLGSTQLFSGGVRVNTSDVMVHENWDQETVVNDIAMIRFSPVDFSDVIQPIALPSGSEVRTSWVERFAVASGFGDTENHTYGDLTHAYFVIISKARCRLNWDVDESQICIISRRRNAIPCHGDSGGPLAVYNSHRMVLIGVASYVRTKESGDCRPEYPAVYTRVTYFIDWIKSLM